MNSLIVIDKDAVRVESLAVELKQNALAKASVIEEVNTAEEQVLAVQVQTELKGLLNDAEKARKSVKEPFLEMGRRIDSAAAAFIISIKQEHDRVSRLVSDFQVREQERVQAKLREQAEEAARIEREAAEAKAKAEREAMEATKRAWEAEQAALRAAARERDMAKREQLQAAAAAQAAEAAKIQLRLEEERKRQDELALQQKEAIGPAPTAARVAGQRVAPEWVIDSVDIWAVVKSRPDLVKVELKVAEAKAELKRGVTIKGITAHETQNASTRGRAALTLDV